VGGRCFSLFYRRGDTDRHRLGLTVPKQVGGAVVRNRVKRRLREVFRLNRGILGDTPLDLVINVYPPGGRAESAELRAEFLRTAGEAVKGRGRPGNRGGPRRKAGTPSGGGQVRSTGGGRG
jgi:ribonuclease P protein component